MVVLVSWAWADGEVPQPNYPVPRRGEDHDVNPILALFVKGMVTLTVGIRFVSTLSAVAGVFKDQVQR